MKDFTLKELLEGIPGVEQVKGKDAIRISNIVYDSRKAAKGSAFVCIEGYKKDGHEYIGDAIKNGATVVVVQKQVDIPGDTTVVLVKNTRYMLAVLADRFYKHPSGRFKLTGVTGTNGKTTTTFLIKSVLEKTGKKVGLIGTTAVIIDNQKVPAERTTPESSDLQRIFTDMAEKHIDNAVMEVSSHSLELHRVDCSEFDTGVFTNLTRDHLDFHITFENYFNAKLKLFEKCRKGIINVDDEYGKIAAKKVNCAVVTYGINNAADIMAKNVVYHPDSVEFEVVTPIGQSHIKVGMPGKINVYNALAAIGVCLEYGSTLDNIAEGLERVSVPGRSEVVETGRDFTIIIDYAHSPDGLQNILSTVKSYAPGRVISVFGCGGDRDKAKRPMMGEISGRLADFSVITSDNPRTEDPLQIISHIEEGIKKTGREYILIADRKEAIRYAIDNARPGDVIVLAGKGHETYQIFKDKTIHFDEREVIREILQERGK